MDVVPVGVVTLVMSACFPSTQVFASIQTQVLVEDPYYNEGTTLEFVHVALRDDAISFLNRKVVREVLVVHCALWWHSTVLHRCRRIIAAL